MKNKIYKTIYKDRITKEIYNTIEIKHNEILDGEWKYKNNIHTKINDDLTSDEYWNNVASPREVCEKLDAEWVKSFFNIEGSFKMYVEDLTK